MVLEGEEGVPQLVHHSTSRPSCWLCSMPRMHDSGRPALRRSRPVIRLAITHYAHVRRAVMANGQSFGSDCPLPLEGARIAMGKDTGGKISLVITHNKNVPTRAKGNVGRAVPRRINYPSSFLPPLALRKHAHTH